MVRGLGRLEQPAHRVGRRAGLHAREAFAATRLGLGLARGFRVDSTELARAADARPLNRLPPPARRALVPRPTTQTHATRVETRIPRLPHASAARARPPLVAARLRAAHPRRRRDHTPHRATRGRGNFAERLDAPARLDARL